MKKLLPLVLLAVAFSACKKEPGGTSGIDQGPDKNAKTYHVKLSFAGFSSSVLPFAKRSAVRDSSSSGPRNYISFLDYYIFTDYVWGESGTNYFDSGSQKAEDANFGNINLELPAGTYHIFLLGASGGGFNGNTRLFEEAKFYPRADSIYDSFSAPIETITVPQDTNKTFVMDRVTALASININDPIREGTSKIRVTYYNTEKFLMTNGSSFSTGSDSVTTTTNISSSDIGKTNFKIPQFLLASGQLEVQVRIQAFDASGKVIAERFIPSVALERNHKTLLSGNLFGRFSDGTNVSVRGEWGQDIVATF